MFHLNIFVIYSRATAEHFPSRIFFRGYLYATYIKSESPAYKLTKWIIYL